jgi:hypothetical protein
MKIILFILLLSRSSLAANPLQWTSFPRSAVVGNTYTLTWEGGDGTVRTDFLPIGDMLIYIQPITLVLKKGPSSDLITVEALSSL